MQTENTSDSKVVYLRIGEDCFYKIKDKECISISISRNYMPKLVALPSGYIKDVYVISKQEFDQAKEKIFFD